MLLLHLVKNISLYFKKRIAIRKLKKLVSEIKWQSAESIDHVISHVKKLSDLMGSLDHLNCACMVIFQLLILKRYVEKDDKSAFYAVLASNVNNAIRILERQIYD